MKFEDIRTGMKVDYITGTGERIYIGKVIGIGMKPFIFDGLTIAMVKIEEENESSSIKYLSPSNIEPHIEPHIEHITTDLLAEKLNELEDIVDDREFIFVAIEEMGELTQCLTKYLRANDENHTYDFDHLHEEFADVLVCMNHLKSIFGFDTQETRKRMLKKLDRAIERSK